MLSVTLHRAGRGGRGVGAEPAELWVDAVPGERGELTVDGSRALLDGDVLRVEGPERDVLVHASGRPVQRARGARLTFDLEPARLHRWDPDAVAAAQAADAASPLRHRYEISPSAPAPGEPVTVWLTATVALSSAVVRFTTDGSEPSASTAEAIAMVEREPGRWAGEIPGQPTDTWVRYRIETLQTGVPWGQISPSGTPVCREDAAAGYIYPVPGAPFVRPVRSTYSFVPAPAGDAAVPAWVRDAVIYQALVDRFAGPGGGSVSSDGVSLLGFAGGTLDGLIARLDHIAAIGCTALWVSPLHAADTHAAYDVRDLFSVERRFGTNDDARRLCDEAHRRGLRVILDIELSYLGAGHPIAAAGRDPSATEARWFHWHEGRRFGWYGGNPTFVALDHHHPEVRRHLLDAVTFWLELGFDGFRLDSAHAAPLDFWTALGRHVRQVRPDAFLVAEHSWDLDECRGLNGRVHGFLDFAVSNALRGLVATGEVAPSRFDEVVRSAADLPSRLVPVRFTENHDGDRLGWPAGGDERRLRLGLQLLLTLPGVPVLYYGTEIGLEQTTAGDCDLVARTAMPWANLERDVGRDRLAFVRSLVDARRSSVALRRGDYETLMADDATGVYAFARRADDEEVVVVANLSTLTADVRWSS